MSDIKGLKGLIIGGYNTLSLEGVTRDGISFTGSQDIKVINNIPAKK